jgi:menaquinone-dependent protoporphyrinogen IX oxidase
MRTLVVYYSLAGTTRTLAQAIARELGADVEEIRCRRYYPRPWGILKAGFDSVARRLPPIEAPELTPGAYDLVLVGAPMWASHPATPVQAFLRREAGRLPASLGCFLTFGGSPAAEKALGEMAALAGRKPVATLAVRDRDVKSGGLTSALAAFTAALRVPIVS